MAASTTPPSPHLLSQWREPPIAATATAVTVKPLESEQPRAFPASLSLHPTAGTVGGHSKYQACPVWCPEVDSSRKEANWPCTTKDKEDGGGALRTVMSRDGSMGKEMSAPVGLTAPQEAN